MSLKITPTGAACGAVATGIDIASELSGDLIDEPRSHWLEHKVLIFPDQKISDTDLERFSSYLGELGDDPIFAPIGGREHVCAIQRKANETAPVFAEFFHSDWSFLEVPPAGTALYGITIPPEGVYGDNEESGQCSMRIRPSEKAREKQEHPLVKTHRETGKKALFSSLAYIQGFVGMEKEAADALLIELYAHQSKDEFVYRHKWHKDMLVMWDNRSVLHSATGGYDVHDRLLHRTTIADSQR